MYAMTEAHVLMCEVIEEVWTTTAYNSIDKVLSFNIKGNYYSVNGDILSTCLNFPANTHVASPTENEIRTMLVEIN